MMTGTAAVGALDAGSAPSDMAAHESAEISAGISRENASSSAVQPTSTLAIPPPELLTRAAALGALGRR
jgi:hypothetical protein